MPEPKGDHGKGLVAASGRPGERRHDVEPSLGRRSQRLRRAGPLRRGQLRNARPLREPDLFGQQTPAADFSTGIPPRIGVAGCARPEGCMLVGRGRQRMPEDSFDLLEGQDRCPLRLELEESRQPGPRVPDHRRQPRSGQIPGGWFSPAREWRRSRSCGITACGSGIRLSQRLVRA